MRFAPVLFVALGLVCHAFADDEARQELLAYLPAETGLVIEGHQLGDAWQRLVQTELASRVVSSELFADWEESSSAAELRKAGRAVRRETGQPALLFLKNLFGTHVLLAAIPQGDDEPVGLLLTRAVSAEELDRALDAWKRLDPAMWSEREQGGQMYFVRQKRDSDETLFVHRDGPILLLSDSEEAVRMSLAAASDSDAAGEAVIRRHLAEATASAPDGLAVSLVLSCRAWDAAIGPANDPVAYALAERWRASDWLAGTLVIDEHVSGEWVLAATEREADGGVVSDPAELPKSWQELPADVFFAAAGRFDFGSLAMLTRAPSGQPRELAQFRGIVKGLLGGRDLFDDVLPLLGPDWSIAIGPAEPGKALPISGVVRVKHRGDEDFRKSVASALSVGLGFWSAAQTAKTPDSPLVLKTDSSDAATTFQLAGAGDVEFGVRVDADALAFGSPLDAFGSEQTDAPSLADEGWVRRLAEAGQLSGSTRVVLNLAEVRRSRQRAIGDRDRGRRGWEELLTFGDYAYLSVASAGGKTHVRWGLLTQAAPE